jgi:hypothetical protein
LFAVTYIAYNLLNHLNKEFFMKMKSNQLLNSKGIALPAVIVISTIVMGSITFMLSNNVTDQNVSRSGKNVATDTIISGVFVYADYLLKNRKCISTTTGKILPPNTDTASADTCDADINWNRSGNLARLLISDTTSATLKSVLPSGHPEPKLEEIEFTASVLKGSYGEDHPLRVLLQSEVTKYDEAVIKYKVLPNDQGIEGYFFVETNVKLYSDGEKLLEGTQKSLYSPLMVNNYVLALNRNLTLTDEEDSASDVNDNGRSPNMIFNSESGKLVFDSPVLINQNLILPTAKSSNYNNTYFKGRVDLGGALQVENGTNEPDPFLAEKGGKTLADYPGFAGFKSGIRNITMDKSLEALFMKDLTDPNVRRFNFTVEVECPKYIDRKENCLGIDESKLMFSPLDADSATNGKFLFALSKENEFTPLSGTGTSQNDYGGIVQATSSGTSTFQVRFQNSFDLYSYNDIRYADEDNFYTGGTTTLEQFFDYGDLREIDMGVKPNPEQFDTSKIIRLSGASGTNTVKIDLQPFMRLKEAVLNDWNTKSNFANDQPWYYKIDWSCSCTTTPGDPTATPPTSDSTSCSTSSSSTRVDIDGTTAAPPASDDVKSCSVQSDDGRTWTIYDEHMEGSNPDLIIEDRPVAFLNLTFVKETNYRYLMTVELEMTSGKDRFKAYTGGANHWEWILSDDSQTPTLDDITDHILFKLIIDPLDFTYTESGALPAAGDVCEGVGPHKLNDINKTITFRIPDKFNSPDVVTTQLSGASFGGTGDARIWYVVGGDKSVYSGDSSNNFGQVLGLSLNEKRSLRSSVHAEPPPDFQTACTVPDDADFDPVSIDPEFRKNAFDSWNFYPISKIHQYRPGTPDDDAYADLYDKGNDEGVYSNRLILDDHNHNLFHVYSVLDYCVVKPGAKQVMGFFTCRRLRIESRTNPLNMIGTFVVDQLEFDDGALSSDIHWMNIFHPGARDLLVANKILRDNCNSDPNHPFWSVSGSSAGDDYAKIQDCRPADIMQKADPFKWTSFKPECGPDATGTLRSCIPKGLYKHFISFIMSEKFER